MTYRQAVIKVLRENGLSEEHVKTIVRFAMMTMPTPEVENECTEVYKGRTEEWVLDKIRQDMRDFKKKSPAEVDTLMAHIHKTRSEKAKNN